MRGPSWSSREGFYVWLRMVGFEISRMVGLPVDCRVLLESVLEPVLEGRDQREKVGPELSTRDRACVYRA